MKPWMWIAGAGAALVAYFISQGSNVVDAITNVVTETTRTPQDILDAVAAIDPAHNPELQPGYTNQWGTTGTWCNAFIALVTARLGAPVPSGMNADGMISWLDAGNGGWYPVSKADAQTAALEGHLAIATYYNFGGSGHMALVLPYPGSMQTAQAGAVNYNVGPLERGFGQIQPVFFMHG